MRTHALTAAVLVCLTASYAHAAAPDDLAAGTDLFLRNATVALDGQAYRASNVFLPKAPGTLDVSLSLRSLGIDRDDVVTLTGTAAGDYVVWTLAPRDVVPPLDMGGGIALTRVDGRLTMHAGFTPGDMPQACGSNPCDYDVMLTGALGGYLHAQGTAPWPYNTFDGVAIVGAGEISGGLPRARLSSFAVSTPRLLCSSPVARRLSGEVWLAGPARTGGADVDLGTSLEGVVTLPRSVGVRAGEVRAPFSVTIPPNFQGAFTVTASAGGVTRSQLLGIRPASDCAHHGAAGFSVAPALSADFIKNVLGGCAACVGSVALNSRGDAFAITTKGPFYASPQTGVVSLSKVFAGYTVATAQLNDIGQLSGTMKDAKGGVHGFLLSSFANLDGMSLRVLDGLTPRSVNGLGAVFGDMAGGTTGYFNSEKIAPLDVGISGPLAVGADDLGFAYFGSVKQGTSIYRFDFRQATPIDGLGGAITATRVHAFGTVVGGARDEAGYEHAFLLAPGEKSITDLGAPPGYVSARATSSNAAGWIVGTATGPKGEVGAFLYTPGDQMVDLSQWVDPKAGLTITDVLTITDGNQILVRGTQSGVTGFYVLSASLRTQPKDSTTMNTKSSLRGLGLAFFTMLVTNCSGGPCGGTPTSDATHGGLMQPCNNTSWFEQPNACDNNGLICDASHHCAACGGLSEPACMNETCSAGLWAVRTPGAQSSTCTHCGSAGLECCPHFQNPCPGGGICGAGNRCFNSTAECTGSMGQVFHTDDAAGCAASDISAFGNNGGEVTICANDLANAAGVSLAPAGATRSDEVYCIDQPYSGRQTTRVFSWSGQGSSCASALCGVNCVSVTAGRCL